MGQPVCGLDHLSAFFYGGMPMNKRETEFLTPDEAGAMLRVPDRRTVQGKRDFAVLMTMFTTGVRKAELCGVKVGDIKTYRNQAILEVLGKGKKKRRIPLKHETLLAIKDYWKAEGNGTDPQHHVFYTLGKHGPYDVRPLSRAAVDLLVKRIADRALIKKRLHPHSLRHTFATTLLDTGTDLKTVQNLMGHSHIRTTEVYLHTTDDRKVEAVNSLQFGK